MKTFGLFKRRPWLGTAMTAAAIVVILLAVPISYTRTTGYDVRLDLPAGLPSVTVERVGREMAKSLNAESWNAESGTLIARLPARPQETVERTAHAFAAALTGRGIPASARVEPIREKVSTNLVAYASGRIVEIRVDGEGKTAEELEAEIRSQLEAAGFGDADVDVTKDGDRTQIYIQRQHEAGGEGGEGGPGGEEPPEFRFQINGEGEGGTAADQRRAEVRVHHNGDQPMTDAELKAEVERQLREQGVDAEVTVENGRISVHPR